MNSFHALLLSCSCFLMIQIHSFHIQAEGIEFNDNVHGKNPITISLNNSSNDDEEIHLGVNISIIENPSDINSTLFTLNTSETELFYAPAFSLQETDQQFYENNYSSESLLLDKNISDQEAIQNENLQTTFNTLLETTTLALNQVSINLGMAHVQADTVGIHASDNKTGWLFDENFYTTSIPGFENALNLTHEHNIAFEAIQNSSFTLLDSLNTSFQNLCPFYIPHPLTHRIDIQFSVLNESIKHDELLKSFVIYLQHSLQEKKCESIVPLSLTYGKYFVYSWTNASVSSEFCNEAMLTHIKNKMFNGSQLSISFTKVFLPYFNIQDVTIIKLGICAPNRQPVSSGTVAVIVVLALTVLPCCFLAFFKFINYRKLQLKNKDLMLHPRVAFILDTDCQQSVSKSHGSASINCAFEPEMDEY